MLDLLKHELKIAMALTGQTDVKRLDSDLLLPLARKLQGKARDRALRFPELSSLILRPRVEQARGIDPQEQQRRDEGQGGEQYIARSHPLQWRI